MTPLNVKNSWITYVHAHSILLTRFIPFCPPTYSTSLDNLPSQNPNGVADTFQRRSITAHTGPPFTARWHPHVQRAHPPAGTPWNPCSSPPLSHLSAPTQSRPRSPRPGSCHIKAIFCSSSSLPATSRITRGHLKEQLRRRAPSPSESVRAPTARAPRAAAAELAVRGTPAGPVRGCHWSDAVYNL